MSKTIIDIDIRRPVEVVFDYITNFENNPNWQAGMKTCRFTSEGTLAIGTTYEQVAVFFGRKIITTFEVIEYEPNRRIKFVSIKSTFPLRILRSVEPITSGTHVQAVIEGEPAGFLKLLGPLLDVMVKKTINRDYKKLKHLLENEINPAE